MAESAFSYQINTDLIKSFYSVRAVVTVDVCVEEFEVRRIQELEAKRDLRKSGKPSTSNFECQICHRMCRSRIGLLAHNKSHS